MNPLDSIVTMFHDIEVSILERLIYDTSTHLGLFYA